MKASTKTVSNDSRRSPQSIIRLPTVKARTGLSRSTLYALLARREFPAQISLGKRAIGFIESEIDAWIQDRIVASRTRH